MIAMIRRISWFLIINLAVYCTMSLILSAFAWFGIRISYNNIRDLSLMGLLFGMTGSLISLMLSRWIVKKAYGVRLVVPQSAAYPEQMLYEKVKRLSKVAGLSVMPEVGIYDDYNLNAFATGPSRSSALVAVSSGLLSRFREDELEGVLAHEIAHIANGDMVTMALLQGVLNAFVFVFGILITNLIVQFLSGNKREKDNNNMFAHHGMTSYVVRFFVETVLLLLSTLVLAAFSRYREFRADAGGARFAGKAKMIAALERLQASMSQHSSMESQESPTAAMAAFKISSDGSKSWLHWFSTHPPLSLRVKRLKEAVRL